MSCSVLIVEDDVDVAEALALILEDAGYAPEIAPDGAKGLERLNQGAPPGLILLDLMMPMMNGSEFRRRQLRIERAASIPVVVLSADTRAPREATELGCAECLMKPVELERLLETVGRFCERC